MKHLHDAEFVDLIEGTLAPDRVAHVKSCEACREQVAAMQSTLASARVDPEPEPSPLYWQQFTRRVNERIDAPAPAGGWFTLPRFAMGVVALLVLSLVSVSYFAQPERSVPPEGGSHASATAPVAEPAPAWLSLDDLETDEGWAIVRAAAEDLDAEDAEAAGLAPGAGAVERVAAQLTDAERAELIRLIEDELKRSGA